MEWYGVSQNECYGVRVEWYGVGVECYGVYFCSILFCVISILTTLIFITRWLNATVII